MDEVGVAGIVPKREVVTTWKQRIEGLQDIVVGVLIAGRGVELNPEPWSPRDFGKRITKSKANGPSPDAIAPNISGLAHAFDVAVETVGVAGKAGIEGVAQLVSAHTQVLGVSVSIASIISREGPILLQKSFLKGCWLYRRFFETEARRSFCAGPMWSGSSGALETPNATN